MNILYVCLSICLFLGLEPQIPLHVSEMPPMKCGLEVIPFGVWWNFRYYSYDASPTPYENSESLIDLLLDTMDNSSLTLEHESQGLNSPSLLSCEPHSSS